MTTTTDLEATAQAEARRVFGILARVRTVESAEVGWVAAVVFGDGPVQWSVIGGASREHALTLFIADLARRPSLDGAPSRAMIERHFAKCGGYWLVSRVDVGGGSLRPMVLRLSTSVDGASEWMRATIPGVDYGAPWNDRPFRAMQGAKFTPLTADGGACECGDK